MKVNAHIYLLYKQFVLKCRVTKDIHIYLLIPVFNNSAKLSGHVETLTSN